MSSKWHDLTMKRSVIIHWNDYPPTVGCFEMKGGAMHLDKGQRTSQKQKKSINFKTKMFITDNCRLPQWKQPVIHCSGGQSHIHLGMGLCSNLDQWLIEVGLKSASGWYCTQGWLIRSCITVAKMTLVSTSYPFENVCRTRYCSSTCITGFRAFAWLIYMRLVSTCRKQNGNHPSVCPQTHLHANAGFYALSLIVETN